MSEHEKTMCEECGKREAMCIVGVAMGEQMTQRHLCQECMARMSMSIATGNIGQLLGSLMEAVGHMPEAVQPKQEAPKPQLPRENNTCPSCGMTLHDFIKRGTLGCGACYGAFAKHITPVLEKLNSDTEYRGRSPLSTQEDQQRRREMEKLQRSMEEAAQAEDFERAAQLRDKLRALAEEDAAR